MFVYFYFTMAEYESGSVTESSDEEEEKLFVPRKKVRKYRKLYTTRVVESLWTTSSVEKIWVATNFPCVSYSV